MPRSYQDIPEEIRNFLYSPEATFAYTDVAAKHGLPEEREITLAGAVDALVRDEFPLIEFPSRIAKECQVPIEKAYAIAADLAGPVLTPLAMVIGDVAGAAQSWKGKAVAPVLAAPQPVVSPPTQPPAPKTQNPSPPSMTEIRPPPAPPTPSPEKKAPLTVAGMDLLTADDKKELEAHAHLAAKAAGGTQDPLPGAVAHVVQLAALKLEPDLAKRFSSIVESRLRGLRDAFETRALLEASVGKNGVGLSGRILVDVMERIEAEVEVVVGVAGWRPQEAKRTESKGIERVEKKGDERADTLVRPNGGSSAQQPGGLPAGSPNGGKGPSVNVAAIKSTVQQVAKQPLRTPTEIRPKMTDVQFTRKLAGPVEELHTLALADFRRLSKNPEEAILKIKDKVDLLSDQGYERRIAGIKAWRESPLYRLYLNLTQEALASGKSVPELLESQRASGGEVLTMPEVKAIMRLNGELRF